MAVETADPGIVVVRGASEVVFDQDTVLTSGQNPELVVRLTK